MRACIIGSLKQKGAIHFRDVVYPLEMAECFKTGPCTWGYIMVPQVICLPMVCRGDQSLAGERLWHGSMREKFVAIAQP